MTSTDLRHSAANRVRSLNFSGDRVRARVVDDVRDLHIEGPTIVVNPTSEPVFVERWPRKAIPPLSSTILSGIGVDRADTLVLLDANADADGAQSITTEPGWGLLGDLLEDPHVTGGLPFPRDIPLWKGPQDGIGSLALDPGRLLGQGDSGTEEFDVRVNLWFAPAGTSCFIHDQHDFIEVHTQVLGIGRMQKFTAQDPATLYEDIAMAPGYTTPDPFCARAGDGGFTYPWHQYHADTDCVWMAVEYHRQQS